MQIIRIDKIVQSEFCSQVESDSSPFTYIDIQRTFKHKSIGKGGESETPL